MVLCTFITALVCQKYFSEYKWNFLQASLFGSIISATDPVAVVAILRELGSFPHKRDILNIFYSFCQLAYYS